MVVGNQGETKTCYLKAVRLIKSGGFSDAIAELIKCTDLDPNNDERFAAQCLAAYEAELYDSTFEIAMDQLWKLSCGSAFKRALALDCCRQGLSAEAIVYALESVFLDPEDALSIYVLGLSYMAAKNYSFAESCFRRVLKSDPDFIIARSKLELATDMLAHCSSTCMPEDRAGSPTLDQRRAEG
jgi:tetratricopeptide (TPR) repeat protein